MVAKLTNNNAPLKYAFSIQDYKIIFEENYFNNIIKYFTKPLEIIFYEIPLLFSNSLKFINFKIHNTLSYIILFYLFLSFMILKFRLKIYFLLKFFLFY